LHGRRTSELRNRPSLTASWCALVGAPRCGTTSLAHYLSTHPDICFSNPKEPHFFSRRDLAGLAPDERSRVVREQYLDHFFPRRDNGRMLAEGSVSYLYAPEKMLPVLDTWPDAKFIITVRNPLTMLPSLHQRHVFNGDETELDFARAWALVDERKAGRQVPRTCLDARILDYKKIGRLGAHVRDFFDLLWRERCFVSVFDDLVANPRRQYQRILDFLDLPHDSRREFATHRASAGMKIGWLQRLLKRPPQAVLGLLVNEKELIRAGGNPEFGPVGRRVMAAAQRVLDWNQAEAPPVRMSPKLRAEICDWMRDDIALLSGLIGRDLSHWLAPDGQPVIHPVATRKRRVARGQSATA
jgi:hypothetical protein